MGIDYMYNIIQGSTLPDIILSLIYHFASVDVWMICYPPDSQCRIWLAVLVYIPSLLHCSSRVKSVAPVLKVEPPHNPSKGVSLQPP